MLDGALGAEAKDAEPRAALSESRFEAFLVEHMW